jgi:tetratricopeptide (TPR) repeat protein
MASNKFGVNVAFALLVAALAITSITFVYINSNQPGNGPAGAQEASGSQLPENHPTADAADKLTALAQLIAREPQNPDYRTQIANLYYDLGQYDKAADFYQQSLNIRPLDPSVETDLASCFHYLGQNDKALETLDRVLEYSPGFAQAMFNKGIVLAGGKKDVKGAIAVWEDLLRSNPSFPQRAELEQRINQLKASAK